MADKKSKVAPIRKTKLDEMRILAQRNSQSFERMAITLKNIKDQYRDNTYNRGVLNYIKNGSGGTTTISEDLYYMLMPKHVQSLTQKISSAQNLFQAVLSGAERMNQGKNVPLPSQQMKTLSSLIQYRENLAKNMPQKTSVTAFDLETIGGGRDIYGLEKIHGIYDYTFINMDGLGNAKQYSSLIGVERNSDTHKYLTKIVDKINNNEHLNNDERVTYDFISRLGASSEFIKKENGRWISTNLTDAAQTEYQNVKNFTKGISQLVDRIGDDQQKTLGKLGGYKQFIDDIADFWNKDNIMLGHNIHRFDIPQITRMISRVPGARKYAESKGLDLKETFSNAYDAQTAIRLLDQSVRSEMSHELYPEGINSVNPGGTTWQLESIHKGLFGDNKDVHHGTVVDTRQSGEISGFHIKDGKVSFAPNTFTKYEDSLLEAYNSGAVDDDINKRIEAVFNGSSKEKLFVVPKVNGGLYNLSTDASMYAISSNGNQVYYADGVVATLDKNKKGKEVLSNVREQTDYFPSQWNNRTVYSVDGVKYIKRDKKSEGFFKQIGRGRQGFEHSKGIVAVQINPYIKPEERYLEKAKYKTTIYLPIEEAERKLSESIDIIGIGDGFGKASITPSGIDFFEKFYRTNASSNPKGDTERIKSADFYHYVNEISESFQRKTAENAGRSLDQGRFNSLEKGIALAEIMNTNPAELQMSKLQKMIRTLQDNPSQVDIDEFQKLMSGVTLNKYTESFVNEALGGSYKSASTWANLFRIDGVYNGGWADNSWYFAQNIDLMSPGVAWIKSWGGQVHSTDDKIMMRAGLDLLAAEHGSKRAFGIDLIGDWRINDGTLSFRMPDFLRRKGVKDVQLNSSYVNLNVTNQYKMLNSMYRAANVNPDGLDRTGKIGIVKDFMNSLLKENEGNLSKESKKEISKLIFDEIDYNAEELAEKIGTILFENEKGNEKLIPMTIADRNMAKSTVFKAKYSAKKNAKTVKELKKRVKEDLKVFNDPLGAVNNFAFDGDDVGLAKNYQKQIKELQNTDSDAYGKRLNLFNQQMKAVKKYNQTLVESIKNSGGQIYQDSKGRIMASFGGEAIDITACVPKLRAAGGASYMNLNGVSYATTLVGEFDANGVWKLGTSIDKGTEKLSFLQKDLREAEILGRKKEAVLSRYLTNAKEAIRNNDILASSTQKDYRVNTYISMEESFTDKDKRKKFSDYLKSLRSNNVDIVKVIKAMDSSEDKIMINADVRSSILNLFADGILKTEAKLGDKVYNFGTDLKDTALQKLIVSAMETHRDVAELSENVASSSLHVEEGSVTMRADKLGNNYVPRAIESADDVVNNYVNGVRVTNGIKVRATEINNRIKLDRIDTAYKKGLISAEEAKKIYAVVNPTEGGATIVGSLLEKSGYVEGRKVAPITEEATREEFQDSIAFNKKTGKYQLKYGRGKFVKRNSPFMSQFSQFDEETTKDTSRGSIVSEKYLLGEGRDMLLTDAKDVDNIVYQNAQEVLGHDIQSEEDYRTVASKVLNKKIVAEPVELSSNIKTKNLTVGEKNEANVVYTSLKDIKDNRIQNFLNSKQIKKLSKKTGVDFANAFLAQEIYNDIAKAKLENPIFDSLSKKDKSTLRQLLGYSKPKKEELKPEEISLPTLMEAERHRFEDAFKKVFGAEYVSQVRKDMYKHNEVGKEFLETYNGLVNKFVSEGSNKFEAAKKAVNEIQEAVELPEGKNIQIRKDGSIQMPEKDYGVNFDALTKVQERNGIKLVGLGDSYDAMIGIQKVPTEYDKKPKLDDRTLRTLTNQIWDQKEMERVYSNMVKDGKEQEFFQTFGDVIDRNSNNKIGWEVKKNLQGQTLWDKDFENAYSKTFADGEHIFNPDSKFSTERQKNIYNRTLNELGDDAIVSKEYIDDIVHGEDVMAGQRLNKAIFNGEDKIVQDISDAYGYTKIKAEDAKWDFGGQKEVYAKEKNALWKNNTIVDFTDESLGLDDKFLRNYTSTGSGEIVLPGHKPDFTVKDAKEKPFGDIELKEYQSKAKSIFERRKQLKELIASRQKDNLTDEERDFIEKKIIDTRDSIGRAIGEYNASFDNYIKTTLKDGSVMSGRLNTRVGMANRSLSYVFDTNSWTMKNDRSEWMLGDEIDPFAKFTHNGKSLKESFREGNKIGFAVASTADLGKYGFTDEYFKSRNIDKDKWLEEVKTEGVSVFMHRDPNDYHRSTVAAKLYFSDYVNKGSILTSDILAHGMKQDADGDSVATYILGSRGQNGRFVDATSLTMMSDSNVDFVDAKLRAARLQDIHNKSMLIDTYGEFASKQYQELGAVNQLAPAEYNEYIKKERAKALSESINNTVYVRSKEYGDEKKVKGWLADWDRSKIQMAQAIQAQSPNVDMSTLLDRDYRQFAKTFLEDSTNAANFSEEELDVINKGVNSYQSFMQAKAAHFTRTMRQATGEMDTPFTTINMLVQNLRSPKLGEIFGEDAQNMRLTSSEIKALDFLQEAGKEGFMTAKKADAQSIAGYAELVPNTKRAISTIFSNSSPEKVEEAGNLLKDSLIAFGKNVTDRNDLDMIIDPDIAKRLMEQYKDNPDELKKAMYSEAISAGVNTLKKTVSILKPELRSQGLFSVREALLEQTQRNLIYNVINGKSLDKGQLEFLRSNGFDATIDMAEGMIRDQQDNVENMARNVKTSNQVRNTAKMEYRDVMQYAKSISGGKPSGSGLALAAAGLAGAILFTGYVGGNPSVPSGEEAVRANQNRPNPTISPIPTQNPSSINAMRNGPRQGYIINVRGSSGSSNDYIGEAISKAVRQNYSNTQVNINLQTQEQSDITYDQVYDYMQQALF